jgi:hypothetical protein
MSLFPSKEEKEKARLDKFIQKEREDKTRLARAPSKTFQTCTKC